MNVKDGYLVSTSIYDVDIVPYQKIRKLRKGGPQDCLPSETVAPIGSSSLHLPCIDLKIALCWAKAEDDVPAMVRR